MTESIRSPAASTPGRSRNMAAIRRRDTKIELDVRSLLHVRGRRFRVDFPIRVGAARPIRPDIVFTRAKLCVFIDGCFWHGCPVHGQRLGLQNAEHWQPKLAGNAARDQRHAEMLEAAGWSVIRCWSTTERIGSR